MTVVGLGSCTGAEFSRKRLYRPIGEDQTWHVFAVVGPLGAVSFTYLDWTDDDEHAIDTLFELQYGRKLYPMGVAVDCHSPKHRESSVYSEFCPILDHHPCWCDGYARLAQDFLRQWIDRDRDDEYIYNRLRAIYSEWLGY